MPSNNLSSYQRLARVPRPMDAEAKSAYIARVVADRGVKQIYDTPARRTLAAEQAWARAKAVCMVSVTTSEDQFLLFGRLTD